MKLDKKYWNNEELQYHDQCLYFSQYIGQYFSTTSGDELSHRRVWSVVGSAVYYGPSPGSWVHIGNAFLWLRTLGELEKDEIFELFKVIYPNVTNADKLDSATIKVMVADVIYKTKRPDFFDDNLYTIDVHLKMISFRMATTWFDGGKTKEKISITELEKRGWIANPRQKRKYREFYKENP